MKQRPNFQFRKQASLCVLAVLLATSVVLGGCKKAEDMGALADNSKEAQVVRELLPKGKPEDSVGTVGGEEMKRERLELVMRQFAKMFRVADTPDALKNPMMTEALTRMALNKLIFLTVLEQEAKERQITVSDAELDTYRKRQADAVGGEEKFAEMLDKTKTTDGELNLMLREKILLDKVVDALNGSPVKVSEQQIKAFYDANKAQFKVPERIDVRHILVKANEMELVRDLRQKDKNISQKDLLIAVQKEFKDREKKAAEVATQVQQDPKKFDELAKKYSEDPGSKDKGGLITDMAQQTTDPDFWAAATKLKPGEITKAPVKSMFGYHIIRLEALKPASVEPYEKVRPMIEENLLSQARQKVLEPWLRKQQASMKVELAPDYRPKEKPAAPLPGMPGGPEAPAEGGAKPSKAGH